MRQPLCTANARDDAELDFRLTEFGVVGGDDDVALHGELAATAERKTGDRGDHRFARLCNPVPVRGEIAEIDFDERPLRHLLDVGAGGERLVRPGNDHAADSAVGLEAVDGVSEFANQRGVERVECLWAIEPDQSDPAAGFDNDVFAAHGVSRYYEE